MMLRRYIVMLPMVCFIALAVFLFRGLGTQPRNLPSALLNKPLPEFKTTQVLQPQQTMMTNQLKGQVILLNVWASWCVSCRQEHGFLMALAKKQPLALYGLNWKDTRSQAKKWLRVRGNPYRASAFDPSGSVGIDLGVYGVPETFIIDKQGRVRYRHSGPLGPVLWQKTLAPLVARLQQEVA